VRPGSEKVARAKEIAATASGPWSATIRPIRWPISWNASLRTGVAEEAWAGESCLCAALLGAPAIRPSRRRGPRCGDTRYAVVRFPACTTQCIGSGAAGFDPGAVDDLPLVEATLEVAIGFHFCADLVRFSGAYLSYQGLGSASEFREISILIRGVVEDGRRK